MTLQSRLPNIAAELRPKVSAAVKLAAQGIARDAQGRAPVQTGALRDAIHVERTGPAEYAVIAGDKGTFYGHLVEFGTANTGARPFLIPAAEAGRDNALAAVRTAIKGAVEGPGPAPVGGGDAVQQLLAHRGVTSETHYVDTLGRVRQKGR